MNTEMLGVIGAIVLTIIAFATLPDAIELCTHDCIRHHLIKAMM